MTLPPDEMQGARFEPPLGDPSALGAGYETTRPRVGIVLAAGLSSRMAVATGGGSKALLHVGGLSLVERAIRRLLALGLERVVVVVGHHAEPVAAIVTRAAPGRALAVFAERWAEGNGASLAAAAPHLGSEALFLLVTADHVFSDGALEALLDAGGKENATRALGYAKRFEDYVIRVPIPLGYDAVKNQEDHDQALARALLQAAFGG